mmetsp:Transcript_8861/g.22286  ORF Transcript_8861/g.22286 Transcript_8861/m.22286 type:complete len:349 (-) Transcript_8861:92-1138(-)
MGGACGSTEMPRTEADAEISKQIREDMKKVRSEVKLLLLGAGDSGKSTIAKQIKIIFMKGFTDTERRKYCTVIHKNVIRSTHLLVTMAQKHNIPVCAKTCAKFSFVEYCDSIEKFTPEVAEQIKNIWADPGIQTIFKRGNEFSLYDNTQFFMERIDEISDPEYTPPDEHLLLARFMTVGVRESTFKAGKSFFRLVDVGGQRGERRKWAHCFQDVNCVLYCMSLSEYDQTLMEDESVNCMSESLTIFTEVVNCSWLKKSTIVLFLNKKDLLVVKLPNSPLGNYFPEFTGGADYNKATGFIMNMFLDANKDKSREIHVHITCALKTDNIQKVFMTVAEVIAKAALEMSYS